MSKRKSPPRTDAEFAALPVVELSTRSPALCDGVDGVAIWRDPEGAQWEVRKQSRRWVRMLLIPAPPPPPKPAPILRFDGRFELFDLCMNLNRLAVGQRALLTEYALSGLSFNFFIYRDLWHAMRGHLLGSSYGSFHRTVGRDGWLIERRPDGDRRVYDRDGNPDPGAYADPMTTTGI